MRRIKFLGVLGVVLGLAIFGAVAVYASWWWNAQIDVESVDVRTVWQVVDDPDGSFNYHANIRFRHPEDARARIVHTARTETVHLSDSERLRCLDSGIQVQARYDVAPLDGAIGHRVRVTLTADGVAIARGSGSVGESIRVRGLIPGASCSEKLDDDHDD